jgi:hypothetical protein
MSNFKNVAYSEEFAAYTASLFLQFPCYDMNIGNLFGIGTGAKRISLISKYSPTNPTLYHY